MKKRIITENYTPALRDMEVGEVLTFPVKAYNSIKGTIIPRLRLEFCVEDADWKVGEVNKRKGILMWKGSRDGVSFSYGTACRE